MSSHRVRVSGTSARRADLEPPTSTLEADPDDGRAKRIVATDRGWQASEIAQEGSNAVERRRADLVGGERYAVFEEVLHAIVTGTRGP